MDMSTDDMNVGTISVEWFPQVYWIFVGAVIATFTLANAFEYLLYRQRLGAALKSKPSPARPKNWLFKSLATFTAVIREISQYSLPNIKFRNNIILRQPSFGPLFLVLANALLLLVLCFYAINPRDATQYQNLGYRTGYLSLGQLPLIFLLAGKRNIIGWFTGSSYERLNWLHRWISRTLLITVTLHMSWWFADWAPYDFTTYQLKHDRVTQTGFSAWVILLWIVFSSTTPIRGWSYEFFVIQHAVSFIGFIVTVMVHTPKTDWVWIWPAIAVFAFDRLVRGLYTMWTNLAIFHPKARRQGNMSGLWACRAELTALPQNMTRITIQNPPMSWKPGQHAFLSCHSVVPLQSHPFTISSIPQDGKLEFLVKAHKGGTRRFFAHAEKQVSLPSMQNASVPTTIVVAIEGPYGRIRPLRQFDSIVFLSGSTGATFTVPLLRDLIQQWQRRPAQNGLRKYFDVPAGAVTRHIRFVWVVKSRGQANWFANQLGQVAEHVKALRKEGHDVEVDMSIYVTCDESFTADWNASGLPPPPLRAEQRPLSTSRFMENMQSTMNLKEPPLNKDNFRQHDDIVNVREVDPRSEISSASSTTAASAVHTDDGKELKTCQPDGTCCCQTTIEDELEDGEAARNVACECNCSHNPGTIIPTTSTSFPVPTQEKRSTPSAWNTGSAAAMTSQYLLHPSISLLSGRPHPRFIIQKSLEQAQGETAVVVCGPRDLNDDARRACVGLSDERAVHKGTGAQGIWFYDEGFGY